MSPLKSEYVSLGTFQCLLLKINENSFRTFNNECQCTVKHEDNKSNRSFTWYQTSTSNYAIIVILSWALFTVSIWFWAIKHEFLGWKIGFRDFSGRLPLYIQAFYAILVSKGRIKLHYDPAHSYALHMKNRNLELFSLKTRLFGIANLKRAWFQFHSTF